MAYMRGHFYIWEDGAGINIHHGYMCVDDEDCPRDSDYDVPQRVWLPNAIIEEFVAMKAHRMIEEGTWDAAVERATQKYAGGNFGADALASAVGVPSAMDLILARADQLREERGAD